MRLTVPQLLQIEYASTPESERTFENLTKRFTDRLIRSYVRKQDG